MIFAGVSYGDLYNGNMRFDVNVSLAPEGSDKLGTRAEVKNLNSFRSVERAVEYEIKRQSKILDAGNVPRKKRRIIATCQSQIFHRLICRLNSLKQNQRNCH